ncbi:holo-ACP synthase [Hathewaya proteolytica DSM 3090]|uniref:citrate lyase holo-[acyl-carrier protein] synthase n=1 Tax=Hathewaya proteolytica DSM 3090 TaxID=1121331 RepID=A0A1M6RFS5_9CLOT|nr:citrate lyase holo-[acyl-carrier protein] synthase [Hathewaya proteolytica]SHK31312.1 holo-ACP synthase [Hathewaya proteolytica DSM 3090]
MKNIQNINANLESQIKKILIAREERVNLQDKLRNKYKKSIVTLRVNYPGAYKDNEITRGIIKIIDNEMDNIFKGKICGREKLFKEEGPIVIYIVDEEPLTIKKYTLDLEENHELGRLLDIDVYREDGTSISRRDLGFGSRKCFLCNEDAHLCVRQKAHMEDDVVNYIESLYAKYLNKVTI